MFILTAVKPFDAMWNIVESSRRVDDTSFVIYFHFLMFVLSRREEREN